MEASYKLLHFKMYLRFINIKEKNQEIIAMPTTNIHLNVHFKQKITA